MAISEYACENIKVKLTFGNGKVYEAEQHNRDVNILQNWTKQKRENNTSGNPLGIPQASTFNLHILDDTDELVSTNKNSPFYGYMKEGVKVEVFRMVNGEWSPFGVGYTESWNSNIEYGHGYKTTLRVHDRLTQLGLMGIPQLPSFSSIKAVDVLKYLLEGCGLTADEYSIDAKLDLNINYFVTQGKLMRDTLRELCHALLAVIVVDDTGKIIIKPALSVTGKHLGTISPSIMQSLVVKSNNDKVYDVVKVSYTNMNVGVSRELIGFEAEIPNGESFIDNVTIPANTIGIDGVSIEYDINSSELDKIDSIYYQGFQNGLTLSILNGSSKLNGFIKVYGRTANESSAFVYDSKHNEDNINQASVLEINNIYIQNKAIAQSYANKVLSYLETLAQKITIKSYIGLDVDCGDTFDIANNESNIAAGKYYITSVNVSSGTNYSNTIEAIRIG